VTAPVSAPPAPRAVLLDLDDTLFDHAHATASALRHLQTVEPALAARHPDALWREHSAILEELHAHVLAGRMTVEAARIERFRRLLELGAAEDAAARAGDAARRYRQAYEEGWQPVAGAVELVTALKRARIAVVVVTNNIVAEQRRKIERCSLGACVDVLVTSEEVGAQKPSIEIFEVALERAGASPVEAVMIGDNWWTDVEGARAAGIRAIWLNRTGAPSPDPAVPEVRSLLPTRIVLSLVDRHALASFSDSP
jgi:putative hydrolase of the HAD superfamily